MLVEVANRVGQAGWHGSGWVEPTHKIYSYKPNSQKISMFNIITKIIF